VAPPVIFIKDNFITGAPGFSANGAIFGVNFFWGNMLLD
jgi:hypothetical protein